MAFERLDVNGPVPASANDLSQSLRVVLIRLVDLHLEGAARMPGIETNDFEPEIAEFMHQPWRHRSGLDPYAGLVPRMPTDQNGDLFWNRGALTPPKSAAGIVDDANGRHLLRNVQSNKMTHRSTSDSANHRAIPPGPRHYRRITRRPRLSDVHI